MSTLLANPEGVRYLSENKFLRQIRECLSQLDPVYGSPEEEPMFSRERMEATLTSGYFTLLGTLCQHNEGVWLMEQFKIFSLYYHLSELRSRDDLIKAILGNMDYSMDGHPRIILSKIMTSAYKHIRLFATKYLQTIIRASGNEFNEWAIRLLITQLYDPSVEVCEMAVKVLDEACKNQQNLETLVRLRPSLEHLGDIGNPLLLRFLSTSTGFRYLLELDYIESEMEDWFERRNKNYVIHLELALSKALSNDSQQPVHSPMVGKFDDAEVDSEPDPPSVLITPPHFYGGLTRTKEGCDLLRKKGHFKHFAEYVRTYSSEFSDKHIILKLKAVLWAVGHIGSTKIGLRFLEEEDVIKNIVNIAENSPVLSLRGTSYYVLGLISRSSQGADILEEFGWQTANIALGTSRGLCVPEDPSKFLMLPQWKFQGKQSNYDPFNPELNLDTTEVEILRNIGNLSNHILANSSSRVLTKLKHDQPEYFTRSSLFYEVIRILSHYHFRITARRFVIDLFDVELNMNTLAFLDHPSGPITITQSVPAKLTLDITVNGKKDAESEGPKMQNINSVWKEDVSSPKSVESEQFKKQTLVPTVVVKGFLV
ncbi:hypothetical protein K7432_016516 [Basidiobolus ranarum]|uniref:Rapamycin-insensitive companion of mTOR domain-containing protein n=1 Tax=Basidiobolus ranarum TaxID=34480 RepID=A0ABR2WEK2_9FUNG